MFCDDVKGPYLAVTVYRIGLTMVAQWYRADHYIFILSFVMAALFHRRQHASEDDAGISKHRLSPYMPTGQLSHYIFALWFLSFFLLSSFFLAKSQRRQNGCLPYFHTWCGPSVNLECRSEMCCTRLAGNTGRKNSHFGTVAQLCRAISSELRHVSTIGKKLVRQQYLLSMSRLYSELRPTNG